MPATFIALPLLTLALLSATLVPGRYPAAGLLWDWLNGLGFAALAVIVFLGWDSESPASHPRLRLHRHLATFGCLLVGVHALGFLIVDPLLLEYLKPKAPGSMLAGLAAALVMLAVTLTSYPTVRRRCYSTFERFRQWHRLAGIALLGLGIWHVVGTGYNLGAGPGADRIGMMRLILFLPFAAIAPLAAFLARRTALPLPLSPAPAGAAAADREALLCALLLILLALGHAAFKNA